MIKDNGGSAFPDFPIYELDEEGGVYSITHDQQSLGMSLRDYFAAAALQGMLSEPSLRAKPEEFASKSYELADAMLKAREA